MKNLFTVFACICVLPLTTLSGCGSDEEGCGTVEDCDHHDTDGTDGGTDGGTTQPADNTAPLRSPSAGVLEFSTAYIAGTSCAQVRGSLPGLTWTVGADLGSESNGYRGLSYQMAAGTYEISYVGWTNCSNRTPDVWADYGKKEKLMAMTSGARAFVQCNWWNGSSTVSVSVPGCNLKITVNGSGQVSSAGNMASYNGQ